MRDKETGEVWKSQSSDGGEYSVVIVKDHGGIVSALRLRDQRAVNDDIWKLWQARKCTRIAERYTF